MPENEGYIKEVPNKFILDKNLSIYEKMLFLALYTYKGMARIFPSYDTLCEQTGMKRTKLIETLKSLEQKKYIKAEKVSGYKTNIYHILKKLLVRHTNGDVRETDGRVRHTDAMGSPHEPVPVRHTNPSIKKVNTKNFNKEKSTKKEKLNGDLPDWLVKEAWAEWEDERIKRGKKLTERAKSLQIKFLSEHKKDHVKILKSSIMNGYTGLFPLNSNTFNNNNKNQKPSNVLKPKKEDKYDNVDKNYTRQLPEGS